MNGSKLFLDTNIILYLLDGDETLADLLHEKQLYISVITELELLNFKHISEREESVINDFILQCKVININEAIKQDSIRIRRAYNTKLPDSIIIATSLYLDLPLVTSDTDFKKVDEITLIQYKR